MKMASQILKPSKRLQVIDKIGRELQSKFTYQDIDIYLNAFGVSPPSGSYSSKWVYSKDALRSVPNDIIIRIAADLEIENFSKNDVINELPKNWEKEKGVLLFISHLSKDKIKATRLKDCLDKYGYRSFVAHEDIHPTLEWQIEIHRALSHMDAFVSIHTTGFATSVWCQQEVGFAFCRNVKMVAIRMGEDPVGFISKHQALNRGDKNADQIATQIHEILMKDQNIKEKIDKLQSSTIQLIDDIPF
jgi:TIR domain